MKNKMKKEILMFSGTALLISVMLLMPPFRYVARDLPADTAYIFSHWNMSSETKYKLRFGTTFSFLSYMNDHTAQNAIIIMPPDSVLLDKNGRLKLLPQITEKQWASYFVYPRTLVYEKDKLTDSLYRKATHITLLNGWGYSRLNYKLADTIIAGVVPIQLNNGTH